MQHERNSPIVTAVADWWQSLHLDHGDRGARARLKRCGSVLDALLEPETHKLIASVHEKNVPEQKIAILALVLARVKNTANYPSFANALGRTRDDTIPTGDARPRLSPMRFSTLLRAGGDTDEFARALRRALAILDDTPFNVRRFIGDVLFFNDRVRQRWTFEYYHTRRINDAEDPQSEKEPQL